MRAKTRDLLLIQCKKVPRTQMYSKQYREQIDVLTNKMISQQILIDTKKKQK